jgi:His-Xaa-Ser system protein HxsD
MKVLTWEKNIEVIKIIFKEIVGSTLDAVKQEYLKWMTIRGNMMEGIKKIDQAENKIILSKEFFGSKPVLLTASEFSDDYYIGIQPIGNLEFEVSILPKPNTNIKDDILKMFCNALIDNQVRYDLQGEFGKLREMIVEQAFYPLEAK